ncbi:MULTISPECIES: dephospho-CoA kinase [unclassified Flavobacterium]|jgi:dephospho-CoA kinase|uniref:dephospho-CoA kinase n=1 Tax=unclassified Flavobacterium TaxID=196869 RepID=UPI00070DFC40|nr:MULTISPECIES: dephospho-CoA kinase [unclassified Flavobacterium]KRD58112.1 dephospho-CoA kinase [Flavobacterium sp. Root935]BDU25890.1 dephospho-CoA kinase [Flavobacterium sp. GSB-24]
MTKVIGLTGGIGSGKTTIANYFAAMGIPVYIADDGAKRVMQSDVILKEVKAVFGQDIFDGQVLNRAKLAQIVFNDKEQLAKLNAIVHPAVKQDFELWMQEYKNFDYVIYEAAILFESGRYKECDIIITVTAPEEVRIERVIERDKTTREQVLSRMKMQWNDEKRISMSNFVINNDNLKIAKEEVVKILKILNIKQNQS